MSRYKSKESEERHRIGSKKSGAITKLKFKKIEEEYNKNPKRCKQCGKPIPYLKRLKSNFCSHTCSALYNNPRKKKKVKKCITCGKEIKETNSRKYCSDHSEKTYKYKDFVAGWLKGDISGSTKRLSIYIRRWMFEQRGAACWECGWNKINPKTKRVPLQIDHIDGNALNNRPENLRLLCPNCHSLTPTFGSLNNGNGRSWRNR